MLNMTNNKNSLVWWGSFELVPGSSLERNIGPLRLLIEREYQEWRVSNTRQNAQTANNDAGQEEQAEDTVSERYIVQETDDPMHLMPVVADRSVVTEPLTPLNLTSGSEVTLYVSTPLWYRIEIGAKPIRLRDDYIVRSSDTWFGPSTREGELCYASKTEGRINLADVPHRAERAVTAVTVRNELDTVLQLTRLSIPAPLLALYVDSAGMLWTQDMTLVNRDETDFADLVLEKGDPKYASEPKLVSPSRTQNKQPRLIRAFGSIFRK